MQLTEALLSSRFRGSTRQDIAHVHSLPLRPSDGRLPLTRAVLEIDEYVAGLGWDRPALLFALVDTARLRSEEPGLADRLGIGEDVPDAAPLTPVEQEEIPAGKPLDEFLATIAWPDAVAAAPSPWSG